MFRFFAISVMFRVFRTLIRSRNRVPYLLTRFRIFAFLGLSKFRGR